MARKVKDNNIVSRNKRNKKISIILSNYCSEEYLNEAIESVFNYDVTDAERAILDIDEREEYMKKIVLDKDLAMFDIVRLLQRRGNTKEMMACVQKLSVERMQEFFTMNGISF